MKAKEIFEQVKKQHSDIILNAEIIENVGTIEANIKFESKRKLSIFQCQKPNTVSEVIFWENDRNTKLYRSTIEFFDFEEFEKVLIPKPIVINQAIAFYRRKANITQKELSEKIGVRHATISDFENGKYNLGSDKLEAIMNELGLTISKLPDTAKAGWQKKNKNLAEC